MVFILSAQAPVRRKSSSECECSTTAPRSEASPKVPVSCCCTVLTESDGVELAHRFEKGTSNWGWHHFMETAVLRDAGLGFIEDGWSTLIACLSFKETKDKTQTAMAEQVQAQAPVMEEHAKLTGGNETGTTKMDDASVHGELKTAGMRRKKCLCPLSWLALIEIALAGIGKELVLRMAARPA